jgi:hypothetical protein
MAKLFQVCIHKVTIPDKNVLPLLITLLWFLLLILLYEISKKIYTLSATIKKKEKKRTIKGYGSTANKTIENQENFTNNIVL